MFRSRYCIAAISGATSIPARRRLPAYIAGAIRVREIDKDPVKRIPSGTGTLAPLEVRIEGDNLYLLTIID